MSANPPRCVLDHAFLVPIQRVLRQRELEQRARVIGADLERGLQQAFGTLQPGALGVREVVRVQLLEGRVEGPHLVVPAPGLATRRVPVPIPASSPENSEPGACSTIRT